jgi:predicted chitinase
VLTQDQLHAIMPQLSRTKGTAFFPFLSAAISEFGIDTPERTAAVLAQLAHESGQLRFMEEIWGPTAAQRRYEPPSTLATTLGNTDAGDGKRFKGRGPIQLTGRANYKRFGPLLGVDLLAAPERAAQQEVAFRTAGLFWSKKGLNELADLVTPAAFKEITRRINGGFNGLADREHFYQVAKDVLDVTGPPLTRGGTLSLPSGEPAFDMTDEPEFTRGFEAIRATAPGGRRRRIDEGEEETMAKKSAAASGSRKTASGRTGGADRASAAARGMSLHIGLNSVNPRHYAGWSGDLMACEFDAQDMAALATAQKIKPTVLLTRQATRARVLAGIRAAAKALRAGDLFFLSFSGHGGQMPDVSGEEDDKKDETWCLYDSELIDDELFNELGAFAKGVRVVVLSDSCHSGSVVRARVPETIAGQGRSKMMPPSVAMRTYTMHQKFYDKLQTDIAKDANAVRDTDPDAALAQLHAGATGRVTQLAGKVKASVILISGCQDNQTSLDGDHNGAFTEQLLRVWDSGRFDPKNSGTYVKFHAAIKAGLPSTQTPNFFTLGPVAAFSRQRPFTV